MKSLPGWIRTYRIGFALLTLVAVAYQFWVRSSLPIFNPVNFFSFFTIQSNLIAAAVMLWSGTVAPSARSTATADLIRGGAVLFLSITGVVYGLLLTDLQEQLQTTVPWVDLVLHRLLPLVIVVDWLIEPPHARIPLSRGLLWLIYPLLYATYTFVRGTIIHWYPYPFLDPAQTGGYPVVALYCVGIFVGGVLFTWLVVSTGQRFQLVSRAK